MKDAPTSTKEYEEVNALGETGIHQIFQQGVKSELLKVADLVRNGKLSVEVETSIFSNPLHYAAHITDLATLDIIFGMATFELITAKNQLGESPLSLAIAQDNAEFFDKALTVFPKIREIRYTLTGPMMEYASLLHDIAGSNAQRCFNVLKNKCTDYEWCDLCSVRINEQQPCDVAITSGHNEMFQLFAGYRIGNMPTAAWLCALKVADSDLDVELPEHLKSIVLDAKDQIGSLRAQAKWDEQPDIDVYDAEQKLRLLALR